MVERSRVYPKKLLFEKLTYAKPEDLGAPYVQTIPHVALKVFTKESLVGVLLEFTSKMVVRWQPAWRGDARREGITLWWTNIAMENRHF